MPSSANMSNLTESYKSLAEALTHGGIANDCRVYLKYIDSEKIEQEGIDGQLDDVDGILVPGGFGERGTEGKIKAIEFARTRKIPFFGICLGMQMAVIEYARNVCGIEEAFSSEFRKDGGEPVIHLMEEQKSVSKKGGTMRLGACPCTVTKGSRAFDAYTETEISERHRHRYEFNNSYRDMMTAKGPGAVRHQPAERSGGDHRDCRITPGSWAASSIPSSNQSRWSRTRFSAPSSVLPCPTGNTR